MLNVVVIFILFKVTQQHPPPVGVEAFPYFELYGDVSLDRVWFFGLAILNRANNLTCLCSKQCQNLS